MESPSQIAEWLRIFVPPDGITELRALDVVDGNWSSTQSGFFDYGHLADMAKKAVDLSKNAVGVYFVPQPVNPDILARCCNRVKKSKEQSLTNDTDILCLNWLLVDADPVRPALISSTDEEKNASWEVIQKVRDHCDALGWDEPISADSGNGYHLLYPLNALATSESVAIRELIASLADRFDTDRVKIDRSVFNPSRIVKLYGTLARKGDNVPQRPHRLSKILEVPAWLHQKQ